MKRGLALLAVVCTLGALAQGQVQERIIVSSQKGFQGFDVKGGRVWDGSSLPSNDFFDWNRSYVGFSGPEDWRPYTALRLVIENRAARSMTLRVEVRDASSHDYWSRANLAFALAPGRNEIRVPTELFAGESLRPGRALDRARIKSVIFARDAGDDGLALRIFDVRFVREPRARDAGVYAWDFGPEDSAVFPGFEAVGPGTVYTKERGYGLVEAKLWQPYRQACVVRGPDSLAQDCLMIAQGGFRADIPKGRYRVTTIIDHPGPFWGEFPIFRRRVVRAQGKVVVDETEDPAGALARYFRNEKSPTPLNKEELFVRFVGARQPEKTFEVEVGTDGLRLDFLNEGCPQIPCFGLALASVVAVPLGSRGGADFLSDLTRKRRQEFEGLSRFESPAPEPSPAEPLVVTPQKQKLIVLRADDALGEWRLVASAALNLQAEIVDWQGPGAPPTAKVGWGRDRLVRLEPEGSRVGIRERHLEWRATEALSARQARTLFASFRFGADAPPGTYRAKLRLRAAKKVLKEVPVELRLLPYVLPETDIPFGPFGHTVLETWRAELQGSPRGRELERKSLERLRGAGLAQFSFSPLLKLEGKDTKTKVDTTEVDRIMALARAQGFRALVGYGNVLRDFDACRADFSADTWKAIFRELELRAKLANWLPLTLVLCDEPEGDDIAAVAERARRWPSISARARVRWAITTHTEQGLRDPHQALVKGTPEPFLAEFTMEHLPKSWTYYNDLSRWSFGLRILGLRAQGLAGRLAWTWNQNAADPFNPLDGREDDYHWCTSVASGDLVCSVDWYRNVAGGVRDYRRALLLQRLLKDKPKAASSKAAQAWLDALAKRARERTLGEGELIQLSQQLDDFLASI